MKVHTASAFFFLVLISVVSCSKETGSDTSLQIKQDTELAQIKPKKPVRIQLKRKESGEYSWEITGEDVEKVIETDRRLQKELKSK